MDFNIEKYISIFVESQFPSFYKEEGELFVLFVKAYYSWLEETGQPIYEARKLFDYRDIDNTLEKFLEYFQKKYLYGIPFSIISNKRQLLKHVLDVYRSKTNINCYKLLFRMIYNEDVEVYIPGYDILKPSDGTWVEPRYIEVSQNNDLTYLVGKRVIGLYSRTTCVIENYVRHSYNNDTSNILYVSNLQPYGGNFQPGEKIVAVDDLENVDRVSNAAYVLGSLSSLSIIDGGQNFKVGDVLKIVDRSISNGQWITYGNKGLVRVANVSSGAGSLKFSIIGGGFGYTSKSSIFIYNSPLDVGTGASCNIGFISSTQSLLYNTDLVIDQANLTLNSSTYNFAGNVAANVSSTLQQVMSFDDNIFGSIASLTNLRGGNNYTLTANVFIRSTIDSKSPLTGNVVYFANSNIVTGNNTIFNSVFQNNDVIYLQSNNQFVNGKAATGERHIIKEVTNSSHIVLFGKPKYNSTSLSTHKASPSVIGSQFALYETPMFSANNTINGLNEYIKAVPSTGNSVITAVESIDSGLGYVAGELVSAYLYNAISNNVIIVNSGTGYSNNDKILFIDGGSYNQANGFVTTDGNGAIISASLVDQGSGYTSYPIVRVASNTGSGASLKVDITPYNTTSEVVGRVVKSGIGKGRGYWSTTRSFLNSDKYIQDSYYYQDYSYVLQVGVTLNKYKDIIYNTFHHAGNELFGKYLSINNEESVFEILYEDGLAGGAKTTVEGIFFVDTTIVAADSDTITIDSV